ncbi:MAG: hypothetical protein A3F68_07555 [Acidobacteria bacterium RIFCSPLOWO2_12_FULL_54_10]|nr:MAG: hypothetical protein A3F68_07555 [Acidobacteria bacterium RIFCSPLOWO2_12_FULL_54_10]
MNYIVENWKMAFGHLASQRMRTALTMLGIIVGTAIVMVIAAVLTGLDRSVASLLQRFGTQTVMVAKIFPGEQREGRNRELMRREPLSIEEAQAIALSCPAVERVAAVVYSEGARGQSEYLTIRYRSEEAFIPVHHLSGVTQEYPRVANLDMKEGRFFTESDSLHRARLAVVGYEVAQALFPQGSALGKNIDVNGQPLQIVGVVDRRKGNFFGSEAADQFVIVPYETFRKLYPSVREHFLMAQARPGELDQAVDQIRLLLRRLRRDSPSEPDSFYVSTAQSIIDQFRAITRAVTVVMLLLSSIGLLVGGIGVMNILLVSVAERTREIGLRKCLGARRRDIVQQFLLEAIALTGSGGILGLLTGFAVGWLLRWLYPSIPSAVPLWSVGLGLLVSLVTGIFFGLWPAIKASRLEPVVALHHE